MWNDRKIQIIALFKLKSNILSVSNMGYPVLTEKSKHRAVWAVTMGNNLVHRQPDIWPPNFFMEIRQGPLDMSQNTF